nr:MAG: phage portal protein [Caldicoprobacter oshimai]
MAFWNKWLKPRAQTSQEPISANDKRLLEILGIESEEINLKGKNALKEATVFACIRILADAVGKLPLKVYQDKNGKQGEVNHYLTPLLKIRPNPWMSARDFKKAVEVQRLIHGNAYVWIDVATTGSNAGKVIGLYPLDSTRVEIWIDNTGLLPGKGKMWYIYTDYKGQQYKLLPDEILHFKGLTFDGIVGMSPLEKLKETVENAGAASRFLNNSFKNGMLTKGIVHYVGDLSPEAEETFRKKFEQMASGLKNANRISLLPIGYQYQPLSLSMTDAQFLENTELTIRQIAAAFGVKMHQLNDLSRATHTNVEYQQREFYIDTLMDILTGYEQEMTYKLFTDKELEEGYYIKFNVNAILRADPKTRYEAYRTAIQSGFMTPNEVRALEELEPKPGGDRLLINGNMMPIEMAGEQYKKGGDRIEREKVLEPEEN